MVGSERFPKRVVECSKLRGFGSGSSIAGKYLCGAPVWWGGLHGGGRRSIRPPVEAGASTERWYAEDRNCYRGEAAGPVLLILTSKIPQIRLSTISRPPFRVHHFAHHFAVHHFAPFRRPPFRPPFPPFPST